MQRLKPIPTSSPEEGESEYTEVRSRQSEGETPSTPAAARIQASDEPVIEVMLARARALLDELEPRDSRARLLQVAMLRRDEVLLDALLRRFDSKP